MKPIHLIIGLVIIIAGYFLLFSGGETPVAEVEQGTEATLPSADQMANQNTANDDSDGEPENEPGDSETPTGDDAGMEFPTTDDAVNTGVTKEFTVDSFSFGYSMEEIRVQEGDTVTINLTNSGGLHDWVVDEFDAATERIGEGDTTTVTFVADRAGTYEYYCSVGNHRERGMVGTLVVE